MVRKMAYIGSSYLIGLFFASFFSYGTNFSIAAVMIVAAILLSALLKNKSVKLVADKDDSAPIRLFGCIV